MPRCLSGVFLPSDKRLGLVTREDPLTLMIARKIISLAKNGERDTTRELVGWCLMVS